MAGSESDAVLAVNGDNNVDEDWDNEEDKENNTGDGVPLLVRLTESAFSGAMFERRAASRQIQDAFAQAYFMEEPVANIMIVIERLLEDDEQAVRAEITEQLPKVAIFCQEIGSPLDFVVPQHILPYTIKLLSDEYSQVRKLAQNGMLLLLEKGILTCAQIQEHVYPIIMQLNTQLSQIGDDHRTEIASFMCKLVVFVGKEITVNYYLERFCHLCHDALFQVRRVCAASMGEIAKVIGTSLTQEVLLPEFLLLCEDEVWGVRKGCAEVFTTVSSVCKLSIRKDTLTPAFIKLLEDPSKWVRISAYESLGSLIASYSSCDNQNPVTDIDLQKTPLEEEFIQRLKANGKHLQLDEDFQKWFHSKAQELNVMHKSEQDSSLVRNGSGDAQARFYSSPESRNESSFEENEGFEKSFCLDQNDHLEDIHNEENELIDYGEDKNVNANKVSDELESAIQKQKKLNILDQEKSEPKVPESDFNTWQYWRVPVNDVDLQALVAGNSPTKSQSSDTERNNAVSEEPDKKNNAEERIRLRERKGSGGLGNRPRGLAKLQVQVKEKEKVTNNDDDIWGEFDSDQSAQNPFENEKTNLQVQFELAMKDDTGNTTEAFECFENLVAEKSEQNEQSTSMLFQDSREGNENDEDKDAGQVDFNVHKSYMNLFHPEQNYDQDYMDEMNSSYLPDYLPYILKAHGPNGKSKLLPSIPDTGSITQNIVPEALLKHFIEMCSPSHDHSLETELANFCVFSLPAVVYTLGPENWSLVRNCFESLALRFQWKIRYTLAASLHEIAAVLGPDISGRDLLPFFAAMTKDLDEVRIGILRNLSSFIKVLYLKDRKLCLDSLRSFLVTDNKRNWRFRVEFSDQLSSIVELYEIEDVISFLCPIAIELILDSIAGVRLSAVDLICSLLRRLNGAQTSETEHNEKLQNFISQFVELLCHSKRWTQRQIFATLSANILKSEVLSSVQFAQHILPHLLNLSEDPIPNVRIVVAQTLPIILKWGDFSESSNSDNGNLLSTISMLQCDPDQDVQYFSGNLTRFEHFNDEIELTNNEKELSS